jgi:minor extracellular serine protease Vpr
MKKILAASLILTSIALSVIALGVGRPATIRPNANADALGRGPDVPVVDRSSAIVQLKGDPLSTHPGTKPAKGEKIDFNNSAVRSYRAQLSALRNEFKRWLRAYAP